MFLAIWYDTVMWDKKRTAQHIIMYSTIQRENVQATIQKMNGKEFPKEKRYERVIGQFVSQYTK